MRRNIVRLLACALVISVVGCAHRVKIKDIDPQEIETTLFLIGDAGEPDPRAPSVVLDSMKRQAAEAPGRAVVVFLGDNVYPSGVPVDSALTWPDARRRLASQMDAIPVGARGIFIPGNHDWAGTGPYGLYSIRLQQRMIASMANGRDIRMIPGNGCPGPVVFDAGRLRFIGLDTQWWLQEYIIRDAQSNCNTTTSGVTAALRALINAKQEGRVTIVAGHHPLMTGGEHGGYCGITGPFRRLGGSGQDILSGPNKTMRDSLESAFRGNPPLVYAAGHDHNLQVMKGSGSAQYLLVSGAGSQDKASCAVYLRESYYVSQHRTGFMRIDILKNKGVMLSVFDYSMSGVRGAPFSRWLEVR